MASKDPEASGIDENVVLALASSSTKVRTAELLSLNSRIQNEDITLASLPFLLRLLFQTHGYYGDRASRKAVRICLHSLYESLLYREPTLKRIIGALKVEAGKAGISAAIAFVLLEWTWDITTEVSKNHEEWKTHSSDIVVIWVNLLDICLSDEFAKDTVKKQAIRIARRALRAAFMTPHYEEIIRSMVTKLTGKKPVPTQVNSILLGIVSGVCSRLPNDKVVLEDMKKDIYAYFAREIIGSKTVISPVIANALHDFFSAFTTSEDFASEIVPPLERALLRAPEVVLNDIISPLIKALPDKVDISVPLHQKLLKQFLSCLKSSNPVIKSGSVSAFTAAITRSHDEVALKAIVGDILTPLKGAKVTVADQRVLHVQMLLAIPGWNFLSKDIIDALAPMVAKEPSEAVLGAISMVLSKHLTAVLAANISPEKGVADALSKALADKRPTIKRLWMICIGEMLWNMDESTGSSENTQSFFASLFSAMLDIWNDILANPLSAAQSGLVAAGYVFSTLALGKMSSWSNTKVKEFLTKTNLVQQTLATEPKVSFLLNPKVYSKLTLEDDFKWLLRALYTAGENVESQQTCGESWAVAFLYIISASNVTYAVRKDSVSLLTTLYTKYPEAIGKAILNGVWQWLRRVEDGNKEAAPAFAKTGGKYLPLAVTAICSPLEENEDIVKCLLVDVAVLSHHELMGMSESSWIALCQRAKVDPGQLARERSQLLVNEIHLYTGLSRTSPHIKRAAIKSCATLAFVAPEAITPLLVRLFQDDLDVESLKLLNEQDIKVWKTPEGILCFDPLSTAKQSTTQLKSNMKDYNTLKWEAEMRAELEKKKGQKEKKLTAEEQSKVNDQLKKEDAIRRKVEELCLKIERGVGVIRALAEGSSTGVEIWMAPAAKCLLAALEAGAGVLMGDEGVNAYLACSKHVSQRLGAMRQSIGVAVLRGMGVREIPEELTQEPLNALCTRLLYRLRLTAEQRKLDTSSLAYILQLILLVLATGGVGTSNLEEKEEQVVLALEFLTFHMEACSDPTIDRAQVIEALIQAMRKYAQHYKLIKDCLLDLCRCISNSITANELDILIKAAISPEVSVRTAILQAIEAELDLDEISFSAELWLACHDEVGENVELANGIWEQNDLAVREESITQMVAFLESRERSLRGAAARSLAAAVEMFPNTFVPISETLKDLYREKAKLILPQYDELGMMKKINMRDPWEARSGVALAFKEMAKIFDPEQLVSFARFLIEDKTLGDRVPSVREEALEAATTIIALHGHKQLENLMRVFEQRLEGPDDGTETSDRINEAVIVLYGALGRHLKNGDNRIPAVVNRLLATLSVPSESVQYAVADCLPPLIKISKDKTAEYLSQMLDKLFNGKKFAERRGAAYGLAGIVKGRGIGSLKEFRIMNALKAGLENKKDPNFRQGALFGYELLALILGKLFEPYVIQVLPLLLSSFGDSAVDVREACGDAVKVCFSNLSSYGVKVILPTLLQGLDEDQWRSKKGACDMLGNMAYLSPHQLSISLPEIIPPLANVLNDSHKEVRAAANRALLKFGEVITNPEVKDLVGTLLKALSDPTKYTNDALDALMKVSFVHYLDPPSLALIVRILERGLGDRSATKKKAAHIIGSLAHLTDRNDITIHIPILVSGLKQAIVDPVPATRSTASKALGTLVEKLGEDALPDIIPGLMATLKSDTGAGDRLGSAQALSEVLAGLGTQRFEETLPSILQNATSAKPAVREGFMSLFIYLPACFGNSFSGYLNRIIPPILAGLADDVESIRDVALRAGRLLVKNFASRAIDLLLPELERGLADVNHRIRLSSVELVGDLLFNLTGISGKTDEEETETSGEVTNSLLEVLGQEKRDKILSALYICRCDTSGQVRLAAVNVWKALVSSPRTLKDLIPTLTQLIIRRLASPNLEQRVIAGQALGELIRKAGDGVLSTLLPTLEEGLQISADIDSKQGICVALRELISSTAPESLEEYEKTLVSVVRTALVDSDDEVREAAAEAFDALQKVIGKRAVDQVLPHLLNLLRSPDEAEHALAALLTLLTDNTRAGIILPNLIPTLIAPPINSFNARALASLAKVAGSSLNRRLPSIMNALMDNIVTCKDSELLDELKTSFDTVLLSVDEYDGLNTAMAHMLTLAKHDDHKRRAATCENTAHFFEKTDIDYSRYTQDFIRILLQLFNDPDTDVVKGAWKALNELTKKLKKEEMESLVPSTRQVLQSVGVAGHNLPGFVLPKGINAILPIFLQGLMYGTTEQRTQSALAISDIIDRTSGESLRPFVTQITGPLIRVVSERSVEVKAAILLTLNNLLQKIPTYLKPFLPQLQRTFAKSLADTSSDLLRTRAAKALGTLITLTPRIDPLIAELVTGAKTPDVGVKNAMLKALYEVVTKAGANMGDVSKHSVLSLIEDDLDESDDDLVITGARLFGALVKYLAPEEATRAIRIRVFNPEYTKSSVLGLNAVLLESPKILAQGFSEETPNHIANGVKHKNPYTSDNCVLAAGKYLISEEVPKNFEIVKIILESLTQAIKQPVSGSTDTKRLALVVVRTVSRVHFEIMRPHLQLITPAVFSCVRDTVIPVKLAADQAFIALFQVTTLEDTLFEKYISTIEGPQKRSMQDYFRRVATKLAAQQIERNEAGGAAVGLNSDEDEDIREILSVGRLETNQEGWVGD